MPGFGKEEEKLGLLSPRPVDRDIRSFTPIKPEDLTKNDVIIVWVHTGTLIRRLVCQISSIPALWARQALERALWADPLPGDCAFFISCWLLPLYSSFRQQLQGTIITQLDMACNHALLKSRLLECLLIMGRMLFWSILLDSMIPIYLILISSRPWRNGSKTCMPHPIFSNVPTWTLNLIYSFYSFIFFKGEPEN